MCGPQQPRRRVRIEYEPQVDEEAGTIEEVYEPYLIQLGFLERTPRGRVGTPRAFEYFGIRPRGARAAQDTLF